MHKSISVALRALVLLGLGLGISPTWSQAPRFPRQTITIVVPYTPGSGADIVARAVGPVMSRKFGQPVVVENRPGASGTIAMAGVAKSAPDGYTLLLAADSMSMTPSLYPKLPFSLRKDLAAVGRAATGTMALVVYPNLQVKSVAELVELAKSQPGRLAYASPGSASPHHVLMELFKQSTGTDLLHVPYKGMSGAVMDLIGGQVQVGMMSLQVALPHVSAGKLRLLAVADRKRTVFAPSAVTFIEAGHPSMSHSNWFGLFAPGATPATIVEMLNASLLEALSDKSVQDVLQAQGLTVSSSSPSEMATDLQRDIDRWAQVVAKAGIKAD